MTLEQRLMQCRICTNSKMNFQIGMVCSLTSEKPAFEGKCESLILDAPEAARLTKLEREAASESGGSGMTSWERNAVKKGPIGGIMLIVVAVLWLVGGLAIGRFFFYPILMFGIGIYAIVKGADKDE